MIVDSDESVHTGLGIVADGTFFFDKPKATLSQQPYKLTKSHLFSQAALLSDFLAPGEGMHVEVQ